MLRNSNDFELKIWKLFSTSASFLIDFCA